MMNINLSKKGGLHVCNFIGFTVTNTDSPSSDQCCFYTQALKTAFFFSCFCLQLGWQKPAWTFCQAEKSTGEVISMLSPFQLWI